MTAELWNSAVRVLETNWSGDHMVPSRRLDPRQGSWDTAFTAIGLAYANPGRAWRGLRRLFEAQWPDGRVPHVVLDTETAGDGLVQPPMHAIAAWAVYRKAAAHGAESGMQARTELEWLYPRLVAQQEYLTGPRDLGGGGLASIVHPRESDLDGPAGEEDGPDDARHVDLALSYRAERYADSDLLARHPFVVECPMFNAILGAAELALAQIAGVLGLAGEADRHRDDAHRITGAIARRLWDPVSRQFYVHDVRERKLNFAPGVTGLVPLMLPDLPAEQSESILAGRGWRGPIGITATWLLRRGLLVHGERDEAEDLRTAMVRLVHRNGHFERFHPETGEGLGAPAFSRTAALALDLLADRSVPAYAKAA